MGASRGEPGGGGASVQPAGGASGSGVGTDGQLRRPGTRSAAGVRGGGVPGEPEAGARPAGGPRWIAELPRQQVGGDRGEIALGWGQRAVAAAWDAGAGAGVDGAADGVYEQQKQNNVNRLEARLARYWPELLEALTLGSATQLALVATYGTPLAVARDRSGARECMRAASHGALKPETVEEVLAGAGASVGLAIVPGEREALQELVAEIRRNTERLLHVERRVQAMVADEEAVAGMAATVGKKTAAVLVAELGDPRRYRNASCYEKAQGLNLVEESSGKHQGQRRISKRGPSLARWYLYLAVLRLIQRDAVVRAWYEAKVARDGGLKGKALVAVMRKLSRALWHLAHGSRFDARKLFDTRRLKLA